MVCFPQTISHDSGQFFSNFQGFISCGFVGSREIHYDHDVFIRGQRHCKFMHFLLICLIDKNYNNNIYILISFLTAYVIPVYAVFFVFFMMPVCDMSMFLVGYAMKVTGDYLPSKHTLMKYFD